MLVVETTGCCFYLEIKIKMKVFSLRCVQTYHCFPATMLKVTFIAVSKIVISRGSPSGLGRLRPQEVE